MPKTIESKLVMKSEIDDRGVKRMREEIKGLTADIAHLRELEMPSFVGGGGGGRGGGVSRHQQQQNQLQQQNAFRSHEMSKSRSGGGFGGVAGGAVAGGIGGAQRLASAGLQGGGLPAIGGMMQSLGGSISGAFGGAGILLGGPMMIGGAVLGMGHLLTQPKKAYYEGTVGLAHRLGRGRVEAAREAAMAAGIKPDQIAGILGGLETTGAQGAFGTMMKMKESGMEPGMLSPVFGALTRAGGAGARGPGQYDRLGKMLMEATKDIHSIPMFLDQLVGMTQMVEQNTADIGEQGSKELMGVAKWMDASGVAALKGGRGAQNFGKLANWIATPGEAGKEMLVWSTLSADPTFRAKLAAKTAGTPGGGIPTGGNLSYFQMMRARGTAEAFMPMLNMFAGLPGDLGGLMLTESGMNAETAAQMIGYKRQGKSEAFIMDKLGEAEKGGKLGPKGGIKDPAQTLMEIDARIANMLITQVRDDTVTRVALAEESLVKALTEGSKLVDFGRIATEMGEFFTKVSEWAGGKEDIITVIAAGVRMGMRMIFPSWFSPQPLDRNEQYPKEVRDWAIEENLKRQRAWQLKAKEARVRGLAIPKPPVLIPTPTELIH